MRCLDKWAAMEDTTSLMENLVARSQEDHRWWRNSALKESIIISNCPCFHRVRALYSKCPNIGKLGQSDIIIDWSIDVK